MAEDSKQIQGFRLSHLEEVLAGKYKIIARVGVGGFGEVYLGEHTQLRRKVAIKLLSSTLASQEELVKRFEREARAAATLSHPNIIDIYDVGEAEDLHYFVMKYIDGETLSEKMHRQGAFSPGEAIHIIKQVADALAYAHDHDIVHRDIKPANVMLDEYGKPVLMDFGVARVQFEGNLTKTGTLMGTPHYLPPELPLGKKVDGRSDIYSLGIMLYEMLGGKTPFHDENSVALIFKHINEAPQPLQELAPEIDPELCSIVHKMIEKLPEKRFQTAEEVVEALQALTHIYPPPTPSSVRRSTPGATRSTEKLLLLAHEHTEQEKFSKAIELYATVTKRDPNNETAKREIAELINKMKEKLSQQIALKEFAQARQLLSQAEQLSPQNEQLSQLRAELEKAEESYRGERDSEFRVHYDAAQMALERNNAHSAIKHLTRASTINASSPELQELLRQTRDKITDEINLLCEKLDFNTAEEMINMSSQTFPDLGKNRSTAVERHSALYQKLVAARDLFKQEKWKEAAKVYEDFLSAQPPYDFEIFHSLRKEAEESLKQVQEKLGSEVVSKPLPGDETRDVISRKVELKKETAAAPSAAGSRRMPALIGAAVLVIAVIGAFLLLHKKPEADTSGPDVSLLHRLVQPKLKPEEAAKPSAGEISITSTPEGAKVFLGEDEKGVTPLKIPELPFGKYALKLHLKGYKDFQQDVELTEKSHAVEIPATLEAAVPIIGSLMIDSSPNGAVIVINNKAVGVTPKKMQTIAAGKYNLTLKLEGYHDYTTSVKVKENETATVMAQMQEIPKPVVEQPKEPEVKPGMLVQLGPDVTPPKPLKKISAKYPNAAKKVEGTVKLNILISETGTVVDVKLIQSAHPLLDDAAIKAVREWTYEPAKKQGVPVRVWIPVSMSFLKH